MKKEKIRHRFEFEIPIYEWDVKIIRMQVDHSSHRFPHELTDELEKDLIDELVDDINSGGTFGAMMKYFKRTVEGPTEHHPNASYITYSWRGNATSALGEWLEHNFTKIVVGVENEAELLKIKEKCDEIGVVNALITDNGWTEFHGVPTITCLGIGPTESLILDQITGDLKLI